MLLLKTILIFLKNKQKELNLFHNTCVIFKIICYIFVVCNLLAVIGYFVLKIHPLLYKGGNFQNYVLTFSFSGYWYLVFTGFYILILGLVSLIILGWIIFGLYFLFKGIKFLWKNSSGYYKDFKEFIFSNWEIAKLQSGINEKYMIEFVKKDGSICYLSNGLCFDITDKNRVVNNLKRGGFLNYAQYYFFNKDYAYNDYKLDKELQQFIKRNKLSKIDFKYIKVKDFCKENNI